MAGNDIQNTYVRRKTEKELSKLRLGKSTPAVALTVCSVLFLMAAFGSYGSDDYMVVPYLVIGFILLIAGFIFRSRANANAIRIRAYEATADKEGNTSLYDLAAAAGRSNVEKAIADIQLMLAKGFFQGAYIDREYMMLVMTRDGKPIESVEESAAADKSERRRAARAKGMVPQSIDDLLLMTDDEEIRIKLTKLKALTAKIDEKTDAQPTLVKQVKEFKEQYFPAVVRMTDNYNINIAKLSTGEAVVESHKDFELEPNALADNAKQIKKDLVELIDSVIEACDNLIERLYEEDIMDITTDIKSLQTTLASRGLLDSDFDVKL